MPRLLISLLVTCFCLPLPSADAAPELIDRIVAVVDNQIILWSELNYRVRLELEERGYSAYTEPGQIDSLRELALKGMIDEHVLVLKAQVDSVQIDPAEVEEMLGEHYRQIKGRMSEAEFQEMLERMGMTQRQLKARHRKEIRHRLFYRQMRAEQAYRQHITRRDVDAFREAHRDTLPLRLSVSHIHLRIRPSADILDAKLAQMQELKARLDAGEDFADLAREASEDPGTAARAGDLGCFGRGELVPEFEEAAYLLKPGQVSEPVLSQHGYHLIHLREKREDSICASHILLLARSTDEDRARVESELTELRQRALEGEDFAQLAREHSDTPFTAMRGGLWDVFPRDQLPPFLESCLRGLKLGGISEPFFLDDGGHIFEISDDQSALGTLIREQLTTAAIEKLIEEHREAIHIDTRLDAESLTWLPGDTP